MYRLISKPYRMSMAAGFVQAMMFSFSGVLVGEDRLAATGSTDRNDLVPLFAPDRDTPTVRARDRTS
jgi:hypothetical protein